MAENKRYANLNSLVITGNVVKDPELKTVGNDFNILEMVIANNYTQKKNDAYETLTNYFTVKVLGKRAATLSKVLKKGSAIAVKGEVRQERWKDKDGKTNSKVTIVADDVEITHWAGSGSQAESGNTTGSPAPAAPGGEFPEDIPF